MAKNRPDLDDALAAQVMFASDNTCCVCRTPGRKAQIHHIDGDASNNTFENLAVTCTNCHSEIHTKNAFARNFTPETVTLYNNSWRRIVRERLDPTGQDTEFIEYQREAMLELSLLCHKWKSAYLSLYPNGWHQQGPGPSVWETLMSLEHRYSQQEWNHYRSLFDVAIPELVEQLRVFMATYADAFPPRLKTLIIRSRRRLMGPQFVYHLLTGPAWQAADRDAAFQMCFRDATAPLAAIARLADDMSKGAQL